MSGSSARTPAMLLSRGSWSDSAPKHIPSIPVSYTHLDVYKRQVHDRLLKENLKSRLILTVHDELLVETAIEEEDAVRKILEEEMHGAADLAVTLEIDAHVGKNWYEAK